MECDATLGTGSLTREFGFVERDGRGMEEPSLDYRLSESGILLEDGFF